MLLPSVIGWPGAVNGDGLPDGADMSDLIKNTMPTALITPCTQSGHLGLDIYQVSPAWGEYTEYLGAYGISSKSSNNFLTVMYQEISPMGEVYTNNFSQSMIFGGMQEGLSGIAGEAMYVTGKNIPQNIEALSKMGGAVGEMAKLVQGGLDKGTTAFGNLIGNQDVAKQVAAGLLSGQKIDFPMMWRGSGFSAQYDLTIRLYCPDTDNPNHYETLIVAPLTSLLLLALPKTEDNYTYRWPFLVKLNIPGIVNLEAGYVSNLSVIKGGDVNDRAWTGRPNIIDLRLTIAPLYNVALATKIQPQSSQPNLLNEVNALLKKRSTIKKSDDGGYDTSEAKDNTRTIPAPKDNAPGNTNTAPINGRTPDANTAAAGNALTTG